MYTAPIIMGVITLAVLFLAARSESYNPKNLISESVELVLSYPFAFMRTFVPLQFVLNLLIGVVALCLNHQPSSTIPYGVDTTAFSFFDTHDPVFAIAYAGFIVPLLAMYSTFITSLVLTALIMEHSQVSAIRPTKRRTRSWKKMSSVMFSCTSSKKRKARFRLYTARVQSHSFWDDVRGSNGDEKVGTLVLAIIAFLSSMQYASEHPDPQTGYIAAVSNLCSALGLNKFLTTYVGKKVNGIFGARVQSGVSESDSFKTLGNVLKSLRNGTTMSEDVWGSPGMMKIKKVLVIVLTCYVHREDGTKNEFLVEMLKSKTLFDVPCTNKFDMTLAIGDLLLHVCETGYQYVKTGNLDIMFHGASQYQEFYDDMIWLNDRAPYLLSPQSKGFTESEFLFNLTSCIERGASIVKRARTLKSKELKPLERVYADLLTMESAVLSRSFARQEREMPFSLLVTGPSSIGKTSVCNALHQHCAHIMGEDPSADFKYTRNPFSDFWDGFRTECWCIQLDDVAFLRPNGTVDPSVVEFLQLLNCVPYCPNQAALSEKGRTPVRAKLVLGSTNVKTLNTYNYFSEPSAVNRRFPIVITPVPKKMFQDADSGLQVPHTVAPEAFPDYWTFTVEFVSPSPTSGGPPIFRRIAHEVTMGPLLQLISQQYQKFRGVQDKVNASLECYKTVEYCDDCVLPQKYCTCAVMGEIVEEENAIVSATVQSFPRGPMINQTTEAWCDWWDSWFVSVNKSSSLALTTWAGWNTFVHEADYVWVTISCFWVMFAYMPIYGHVRKWFTVRALENHLSRTVGWVFYCWPEMRGPLAQYLYTYTVEPEESRWSFTFLSRDGWGSMGESRADKLKRGALALGIVAVLASTGYALYKFSRTEGVFQSDTGATPTPMKNERSDPWRQSHIKHVALPTTNKSKCSTPNELINRMKGNVLHFDSFDSNSNRRTPGVMTGLVGDYYLVNNHTVPLGTTNIIVRRVPDSGAVVGPNFTQMFDESMISRDVVRDLAVIKLRSGQPVKSILEYFPLNDSFRGNCKATLMLNRSGHTSQIHFKHVAQHDIHCELGMLDTLAGKPDNPTMPGDCGAPMIAHTASGPLIAGIHSLGVSRIFGVDNSASTRVNIVWIKKHMATFDSDITVQSGQLDLTGIGKKHAVVDTHRKSVFQYMATGEVDIYGSLTGVPRIKGKSKVGETMIHDILVHEKKWEGVLRAPVMDSYEPWRLAAMDLVNPVSDLEVDLLAQCVESFSNDILNGLSAADLKHLMVYDTFTAINGAPGITYVDGINRATSAGFPWGHSKAPLIIHTGEVRGCQHSIDVTPEVHSRINKFEELSREGVRTYPVFTACLKDEPVSIKKAQTGKTRVFCAAPFDWSIVVRKYFLSLVRLQQNNTLLFEAASGTIAQSHEWGDIRRHLCKYGEDNMIAGDYKAYDKRMPAIMVLSAFDVMINLYRKAGVSEDDLRAMRTIAYDTAFPTVNYNGDLVTFHGSNPSGHALTVQINSFANSLYMRYCYAKLGGDLMFFKDNVSLITYGDDNAMGVHPRADFFTHTAIADTLADIDITYTMADKEAASIPYIPIDQVSFLKRTWQYSEDLGDYSCPLELASIKKMLMYRVESKTEVEEAQMVSQIRSAHNEFFFRGKEEFEEYDVFLRDIVERCGLSDYMDPPLPTWGEYVERWLKTSPTGARTASGENH